MIKTKNKFIIGLVIILSIGAAILIFSFGSFVGSEFYKGIKAHNGTTGKIEKVLKKNCNCDAEFELSTFGIHFSKENGVNGNSADFTLKGYSFDTTIAEEAARLNEILNTEVEGYNSIDVIHLNFVDGIKMKQIVIKSGEIQDEQTQNKS